MAQKTLPIMTDATGQKIASMLESVSVGPNNIVDNLTTADSTKVLSANMGKTLNDKWNSTVKRNIGELVYSSVPLVDAGLHLADGSYITRGAYADFYDYIVSLVGQSSAVTTGTGHSSTSDYGKYIYDSTNSRVYLPDLRNMFIEGANGDLGTYVAPGLPNITGAMTATSDFPYIPATGYTGTGCIETFDNAYTSFSQISGGSETRTYKFTIDASKSSSIYGNSSTVQPPAIKQYIYIVVANSVKTDYIVDIDNVMTDINAISSVDTYTGTIATYGGTVTARLINHVCFVNIRNLGSSSSVSTGAWRYIDLDLPSKYQSSDNKVAMLNYSGGEDASAQFLCHLISGTLSFYCYNTVNSGQTSFCYVIP